MLELSRNVPMWHSGRPPVCPRVGGEKSEAEHTSRTHDVDVKAVADLDPRESNDRSRMTIEMNDPATATSPIVALDGIHKSFGAVTALRGVSIDVMPGETFALLGDN